MKKLSNLFMALAAAAALGSCSDEAANPTAVSDITVTVNTGDLAVSRAALPTVEGYELKCVMQLLDDTGATVGAQAVSETQAGAASFVIKAADIDAGASKAIFWAEYVPTAGGAKVYDSSDLTNISYATTAFDMSDAALLAAADAFAGSITTLTNGASATLTRPMIQFNFSATNAADAAGATSLAVTYQTTSGYNVLTGNCSDAYQEVSYTNAAFEPTKKGPWFTSLIIAPANLSKFDKEITMTVDGEKNGTFNVPAGTLPMDPNYIVNTTAEVTLNGNDTPTDLNVSVSIDGDFVNGPKPAVFAMGAYIGADGKPVSTADEAVAVVFHVGALPGDAADLYPAEYAGKTIKGYAIAMENITKARAQFNAEYITDGFAPAEDIVNGTQNEATIFAGIGESAFVTAWNNWTAAHALTTAGTTTTAWYLPARNQMEAFFSLLYPTSGLNGQLIEGTPSGSDAFRAMFPDNTIYDRDPLSSCMYATCSVNASGNVQGCSMQINPCSVRFAQIDVKTKTQSVLGRAMFTIFE